MIVWPSHLKSNQTFHSPHHLLVIAYSWNCSYTGTPPNKFSHHSLDFEQSYRCSYQTFPDLFQRESFQVISKFVLYAYRKGDKLKFTDHSPDPNFYTTRILWWLEFTGLVYLPKKGFVQERNCSVIIIMSRILHLPAQEEELFYDYQLSSGPKEEFSAPSRPCFLTDSFFFQQDVIYIDLLIHFVDGPSHCICRITYQIMFGSLTRLLSMPCSR